MIYNTKLKFAGLLIDGGNRKDSWLSNFNLVRRFGAWPDEILSGNFRMSIKQTLHDQKSIEDLWSFSCQKPEFCLLSVDLNCSQAGGITLCKKF